MSALNIFQSSQKVLVGEEVGGEGTNFMSVLKKVLMWVRGGCHECFLKLLFKAVKKFLWERGWGGCHECFEYYSEQ